MKRMLKYIISSHIKICLLLIILVSVSCGNRESKPDLIPQKDLVTLLTDLYITDGLLINYEIRQRFAPMDSTLNHSRVIEKHGYNKRQLDLTLKYYFINNPKKLQKIYDQVLAKLSELQSRLETEPDVDSEDNLWILKKSYTLSGNVTADSTFFSIPVVDTGTYNLSFSSIIYNNDQSINPRSSVYFWGPDTSGNGIKDQWEMIKLKKDGREHRYSVSRRLADTAFSYIRGYLYQPDLTGSKLAKHAEFSKIILIKEKAE